MKNFRSINIDELDKLILNGESITTKDLQNIANNKLQRYFQAMTKSESVKFLEVNAKNSNRKQKAFFFKKFNKEKQLYFSDISPFFRVLSENDIRYSKVYMIENNEKETFLNVDVIQNLETETKILTLTLKVISEMNILNFKEQSFENAVNVYVLDNRELYRNLENRLKSAINVVFLQEFDEVNCFLLLKTHAGFVKHLLTHDTLRALMSTQKAVTTSKKEQIKQLNYLYEKQIENNNKIKTKKGDDR